MRVAPLKRKHQKTQERPPPSLAVSTTDERSHFFCCVCSLWIGLDWCKNRRRITRLKLTNLSKCSLKKLINSFMPCPKPTPAQDGQLITCSATETPSIDSLTTHAKTYRARKMAKKELPIGVPWQMKIDRWIKPAAPQKMLVHFRVLAGVQD